MFSKSQRRYENIAPSEGQLSSFVEQAPVSIAMFDRDMRYLACSARWTENFRVPVPAIGLSHYSVTQNMPESWRDAHRRGLRGETIKCDEDHCELEGAGQQCLRWEVVPWYARPGTTGGIIILAEDITARKKIEAELQENEQRYRWALQSANGGAWSWDAVQDEVWWPDEMYDLWGVRPGPVMKLQNSLDLVLDEDRPKLRSALENPVSAKSGFMCEFRILHKDRGIRWMASIGQMPAGANRSHRRVAGLTMDITERKLHEEAPWRLRRLDAMAQIAANIAHDSNNLLTVILANLQLAEMRVQDPRARSWLSDAIRAAEAGASYNRRLLTLAQSRAVSPHRINLNTSVEQTARLVERSLGDKINLVLDLSPDLWWSMSDPGEIESAVLNLTANARDAMAAGGTLHISTANCDLDEDQLRRKSEFPPGHYVRLTVRDTGSGMTPDVLKRAGEPMFSTKETGKGTGLGLSSVMAFAHQAGGFVELESAVGKGTAVSIFLPRSDMPLGMHETAEPYQHESFCGNGEVILIVDDNDDVRSVTAQRLDALGYCPLEAKSASAARAQLKMPDRKIDLVLADVGMPGAPNGLSLTGWIQDNFPAAKVVLTSAHFTVQADNKPKDASANLRILPKPYPMDELARVLREEFSTAEQFKH